MIPLKRQRKQPEDECIACTLQNHVGEGPLVPQR